MQTTSKGLKNFDLHNKRELGVVLLLTCHAIYSHVKEMPYQSFVELLRT